MCFTYLQSKCELYWPEIIDTKQSYGPFDIVLLSVVHYVNFDIRKLRLTNQVNLSLFNFC